MIIYKATNRINGKIYIGQTIRTLEIRKAAHIYYIRYYYNSYFHNSLRKYGFNNFKWQIICICPNMDILNKQEKYYIKYYDSINNGYNRRSGGLNSLISKEAKKKMSIAHKGKILTEEHKNMIKKNYPRISGKKHWNYGKKHSEETKRKMSKSHRGKDNGMYGKHLTRETKQKLRQANLGKKLSNETKQKISQANLGRKLSAKIRNNMSIAKKNMSEKTKLKMSIAKKNKKLSKEHKRKLSLAQIGKKHSKETKKKMSESHLLRFKKMKKNK